MGSRLRKKRNELTPGYVPALDWVLPIHGLIARLRHGRAPPYRADHGSCAESPCLKSHPLVTLHHRPGFEQVSELYRVDLRSFIFRHIMTGTPSSVHCSLLLFMVDENRVPGTKVQTPTLILAGMQRIQALFTNITAIQE
jgi:hypothetical protein